MNLLLKIPQQKWQMRCKQLKDDRQPDRAPDDEEPPLVKLVEWAHEYVHFPVFPDLYLLEQETVIRKDEYDRCVQVLNCKDSERLKEVDLRPISWAEKFTQIIEDYLMDHIGQRDE